MISTTTSRKSRTTIHHAEEFHPTITRFDNGLINESGTFIPHVDTSPLKAVRECFTGFRNVSSVPTVELKEWCYMNRDLVVLPALNRGFIVRWLSSDVADVVQQWAGRRFARMTKKKISVRIDIRALVNRPLSR